MSKAGNSGAPLPSMFGAAYSVELLYPAAPALNADELASQVQLRCPQVQAATASGKAPILFAHRDHSVTIHAGDVEAPVTPKTVVMPREETVDATALYASLEQTRDWDSAVQAVARCHVRVPVADLFARDLEPRERLALFQSVLLGIIEADRPAAIHWRPAGKVVDPGMLLKASGASNYDELPSAAINVRVFRIKGAEADLLMDTLGLAALMLPDLQIHFHGLDPARVAAHLYAWALHVLKNGDCLDDGDSIEGPRAGQTWTCRHAASLVNPPRPVIQFDPGPAYAGG